MSSDLTRAIEICQEEAAFEEKIHSDWRRLELEHQQKGGSEAAEYARKMAELATARSERLRFVADVLQRRNKR